MGGTTAWPRPDGRLNAWNGIVRFFSAFPQCAYDACDKRPGRVSSLSLVRSRHRLLRPHTVTAIARCVRGYVHEVVLSCAAEVIARHPRSYEQEDLSSIRCTICPCWSKRPTRWIRRLPWPAGCKPPVFGDLRRLLEARMGKAGKREYVQVLRLIESFSTRRCSSRHIGGAGARRDRLRCGQAPGAVPDRGSGRHA